MIFKYDRKMCEEMKNLRENSNFTYAQLGSWFGLSTTAVIDRLNYLKYFEEYEAQAAKDPDSVYNLNLSKTDCNWLRCNDLDKISKLQTIKYDDLRHKHNMGPQRCARIFNALSQYTKTPYFPEHDLAVDLILLISELLQGCPKGIWQGRLKDLLYAGFIYFNRPIASNATAVRAQLETMRKDLEAANISMTLVQNSSSTRFRFTWADPELKANFKSSSVENIDNLIRLTVVWKDGVKKQFKVKACNINHEFLEIVHADGPTTVISTSEIRYITKSEV